MEFIIGALAGVVYLPVLIILSLPACICLSIINSARNKQVQSLGRKYHPIVAKNIETLKQKVAAVISDEVTGA